MQQLYLVGFSADRKSLHLSRSPGHRTDFRLEVNGELVALLAQRDDDGAGADHGADHGVGADDGAGANHGAGADEGAGAAASVASAEGPDATNPRGGGTRSASRLSPREIQARLRNGLTVREVADEAGVDVAWVDRFAAPILAEQSAALARACRLSLTSARRGTSAAPLGVAISRNLEERGVRPSAEVDPWSAHLHHDSTWVIRYSYRWRGRVMEAEWLADLAAGALGARNRLATELGWLDPHLDSPRPADPADPADPEIPPVRRTARVAGAAAPTRRARPTPGRRVAGAPAQSQPAQSQPRGTHRSSIDAARAFAARRRPLPERPAG